MHDAEIARTGIESHRNVAVTAIINDSPILWAVI